MTSDTSLTRTAGRGPAPSGANRGNLVSGSTVEGGASVHAGAPLALQVAETIRRRVVTLRSPERTTIPTVPADGGAGDER